MKIFALVLISMSIWACSSVKNDEKISLDQVINDKSELKYLNIEADISYGEEQSSMGISAAITLAAFDSLQINAYLPFGIQLGKMYANKKEFLFYNMMQNQVMTGVPNADNLKNALQISLSLEDFAKFLRSEFPGNKKNYYLSEKLSESGNMLYKDITNRDYVNFVLVSKKDGSILQFQQKTKEGENVLNVHFGDYKQVKGFNLAHNIVISSTKSQLSLNIQVSDFETNVVPNAPFRFKVPDSATKIELE